MLRAAFVHKYKLLLAGGLLLGSLASPVLVHARQSTSADAVAVIAVAELPAQGRQTLQLIRDGGPFPYEKDGTVFGNRERLLPAKQRGYYLEYTVKTPGSRNRERDASCVAVNRAHRMPVITPATITPVSGGLSNEGVEFREVRPPGSQPVLLTIKKEQRRWIRHFVT